MLNSNQVQATSILLDSFIFKLQHSFKFHLIKIHSKEVPMRHSSFFNFYFTSPNSISNVQSHNSFKIHSSFNFKSIHIHNSKNNTKSRCFIKFFYNKCSLQFHDYKGIFATTSFCPSKLLKHY